MVRHVLSDGTVLEDLKGHVVKKEDVPEAYQLMDQMNKEKERKDGNKQLY